MRNSSEGWNPPKDRAKILSGPQPSLGVRCDFKIDGYKQPIVGYCQ